MTKRVNWERKTKSLIKEIGYKANDVPDMINFCYRALGSVERVAVVYDVSTFTMTTKMQGLGLYAMMPKTQKKIDAIIKLGEKKISGMTLSEISLFTGCASSLIRMILKEKGWDCVSGDDQVRKPKKVTDKKIIADIKSGKITYKIAKEMGINHNIVNRIRKGVY